MIRLAPDFVRVVVANAIAVPLAIVPWLLVDMIDVWSGDRYESVLNQKWFEVLCIVIPIAIVLVANWIAMKDSTVIVRIVVSIATSFFVIAVSAAPVLIFALWFHFAIGGSE